MWPFAKEKVVDKTPLTKATMEASLLALRGDGARLALYYANLAGYQHDTVSPKFISEFFLAIEAEQNFTAQGRKYAADSLTKDIDLICRSDYFEKMVFGIRTKKNEEHRGCLYSFRDAVLADGFRVACEKSQFDPDSFLETTAACRRRDDLDKITDKFEERKQYLKPLLLRAKASGKNKYGELDLKEYIKEIQEFLSYYFPEGSLLFFYIYYPLVYCVSYLDVWFGDSRDVLLMPSEGIDFEHWCAARIEEQGWAVRVSKATGDQGVDVEATKDCRTIVVQCKRYGQPIGNKAVQEVYAGMVYYRADAACVIGTGGFTASASELAKSTGVILLDAQNVAEFTDIVGGAAARTVGNVG